MNHAHHMLTTLTLVGLLASTDVAAQDKRPPTEILHMMFSAMAENPDAQRRTLTLPLAKRVQTEGLSEDERLALGEVYFANLQPVEAKAAFEPFMEGAGARAAMAWERVMQIMAAAEGKLDEVERMLPRYRERFPHSPEIVYGAVFQVQNLARAYQKKGEHAKVVELIEAELDGLGYDAPYRSWLLPGAFFDAYSQAGQADRALAHLKTAREHYGAQLAKIDPPSVDFTSVEHVDGVVHRIEDALYGSLVESNDPKVLNGLRTRKLVEALDEQLAERVDR